MHVEEALISKKELLQLTGISYGQLYRWKRQNLIPETWFIKQSAFTGQETFFPRDKILKRVQMITDLKDQYSLEELADLLSPSTTNRVYSSSELNTIPGFSQQIIDQFIVVLNKDSFTFRELVFLHLFSQLEEQKNINSSELANLVTNLPGWLPKLRNLAYVFVLCQREQQVFGLLIQQQCSFYLDQKIRQIDVYDLEEVGKDLNLKLNKVWEERQ